MNGGGMSEWTERKHLRHSNMHTHAGPSFRIRISHRSANTATVAAVDVGVGVR